MFPQGGNETDLSNVTFQSSLQNTETRYFILCELLTNFPTVDFSLKSDLFRAHVNTGAANLLSLFRGSILYDHKWPCNGFWFIGNRPEHVLYAISQSEARRVLRGGGWGQGGYILGLSHKRGGNFLKYPLPGRGKFFICLNCLKITDPPLGINNEQSLTTRKLWCKISAHSDLSSDPELSTPTESRHTTCLLEGKSPSVKLMSRRENK